MNNILEVKNLNIYFNMYDSLLNKKKTTTIKDLSIDVKEGEIFAIAGSSGSGKSILAHAILGILPDNAYVEGDIIFRGEKLSEGNIMNYRGKKICLVPQSVSYLDPLMRIKSQVPDSKAKEEEAIKVLKNFGLTASDMEKFPFQLSGGMARRVLISTAVLSEADLIIADEPTPGLSLELAQEVLEVFRKLADKGKTVILISHDIDLVCSIANRMGIFYGGRMLEITDVKNFIAGTDYLTHPLTKAFWRALPQNGFEGIDMEEIKRQCDELGLPFSDSSEFI